MHLMCVSAMQSFWRILLQPTFQVQESVFYEILYRCLSQAALIAAIFLAVYTLLKGILKDIVGVITFVSDQIIGPSIRRSAP
ncbi:MAG: hypothetical protein HRT36_09200 [Alphaproteobacteria bacterium]|nr:hypothetical protein [Alphaproteobacteria bacterium]